jgi:uncharacterized protein YbjQ (UPF0145 family)
VADDRAGGSAAAPRAWGSLLSARDFAAVTSVGFDPVGPVVGVAVVNLGYVSRGGKCSSTGANTSLRTDLASAQEGPFGRQLRQRYGARRRVLSRVTDECRALGADGVIGVTLAIRPFPAGGTEFIMTGTAVRARSAVRLAAPFTSHISAQDFARLLRAGWVPAALVFGIALGARHDDLRTRQQTRLTATGEVRGYSNVIRDTRRDARNQLARAVTEVGADGVAADQMTVHLGERECPTHEGSRDHVAEAAILGTAIVSFSRPGQAGGEPPLTIMHLGPAPAAAGHPSPDAAVPGWTQPESEGGFLDRAWSSWSARRASRSVVAGSDSAGITRRAD